MWRIRVHTGWVRQYKQHKNIQEQYEYQTSFPIPSAFHFAQLPLVVISQLHRLFPLCPSFVLVLQQQKWIKNKIIKTQTKRIHPLLFIMSCLDLQPLKVWFRIARTQIVFSLTGILEITKRLLKVVPCYNGLKKGPKRKHCVVLNTASAQNIHHGELKNPFVWHW